MTSNVMSLFKYFSRIHIISTVGLAMAASSCEINRLPDDLIMGFASASHQIEGGWNEDGKGESIWNRYEHDHPDKIVGERNADIACDSYHKYAEDVQLIKNLGGKIYRFSLSWPRILPTGFSHSVNQKGIDYYNNLINELIKNDIEPMVTLFHWDLPQPLQDLGGWTNPILADYFYDYSRVVFSAFGDRVKKWLTFNEPFEFCHFGYGHTLFPPALNMKGMGEYLAGHTVLKAHAKAYHLYDEEFRPSQKGEIGITLSANWNEPKTDSEEDRIAANDRMQFLVGWFAHPIFSEKGDYPEVMKQKIASKSKEQGFSRSRLPEFDEYWIEYIKGTSDFFGFNHYTTSLVTPKNSYSTKTYDSPSFAGDLDVVESTNPSWKKLNIWLNEVPWGIRKSLKWVKEEYNNPIIYITENGCSDPEPIEDNSRIQYYHGYFTEMLKAIYEDGCQVKIYTAWTLMDDFEWTSGYTEKFGLHYIDFDDPERKRIPKKSAQYFKNLLQSRKLPEKLE